MFCTECGKKLTKNAKFCPSCGKNLNEKEEPKENKKSSNKIIKDFMKLDLSLKGLIFTLIILVLAVILLLIFKVNWISWIVSSVVFVGIIFLMFMLPKLNIVKVIGLLLISIITTTTILIVDSKVTPSINDKKYGNSSIVSKGVNTDDLGNIVNGQFYFVDGNTAFYSTFDIKGDTHVYSRNLTTGDTKKIFDGFGWSFVVYEGWLYFSGNPGVKIDATYKLYRIRTDGTNLELLNSNYTYNMYFYKGYIYYMRQADHDSEIANICRANLDGKNEEIIVQNTGYQSIIYENKLYYIDSNGYLNMAEPDGKNTKQVFSEKINQFIIGQGNILFVDDNSNIKKSNPDGSNISIIRASDGNTISRINSYKNKLFYSKYGDYATDRMAYNYSIYSIDITGGNDVLVYSGVSAGIWNNIVDGRLYVLDYAQDLSISRYIAISRNMDLNGVGVTDLYRQ